MQKIEKIPFFVLDLLTVGNDFQDYISDTEKLHRNNSIILKPKSLSTSTEIQVNVNYENALQIVKANVNFFLFSFKIFYILS